MDDVVAPEAATTPSMRPRGPNVCPRCGERVSAFAAGCALCGADLDAHRAEASRSLGGRLRLLLGRLRPTTSPAAGRHGRTR